MNKAKYIDDVEYLGDFDVVFIVKKSGAKLVRQFTSPFLAMEFVNKLKRSKTCMLVSYPSVR